MAKQYEVFRKFAYDNDAGQKVYVKPGVQELKGEALKVAKEISKKSKSRIFDEVDE